MSDNEGSSSIPSTTSSRSEFAYQTHLVIYNFLRLVPSSLVSSPADGVGELALFKQPAAQCASLTRPDAVRFEADSETGGGDARATGNVSSQTNNICRQTDRQDIFYPRKTKATEETGHAEVLARESIQMVSHEIVDEGSNREGHNASLNPTDQASSVAAAVTVITKKKAKTFLVSPPASIGQSQSTSSLPAVIPAGDCLVSPFGNPLHTSTPAVTPPNVNPQVTDAVGDHDVANGSHMSSSGSDANSAYIDLDVVDDVESLVNAGIVPSVSKSLKDEVSECQKSLEESRSRLLLNRSDTEDELECGTLSPVLTEAFPAAIDDHVTMTEDNQAIAAEYLRVIGDRLQTEYGNHLDALMNGLDWTLTRDTLLVDVRRRLDAFLSHMADVWTQVTLTLLFCQRLVYSLLRHNLTGIGDVVELTAELIEVSAASFIINSGGWQSIAEIGSTGASQAADLPHDPHSTNSEVNENVVDQHNAHDHQLPANYVDGSQQFRNVDRDEPQDVGQLKNSHHDLDVDEIQPFRQSQNVDHHSFSVPNHHSRHVDEVESDSSDPHVDQDEPVHQYVADRVDYQLAHCANEFEPIRLSRFVDPVPVSADHTVETDKDQVQNHTAPVVLPDDTKTKSSSMFVVEICSIVGLAVISVVAALYILRRMRQPRP